MANLKKRLGNAGVDLSNPKLNESFVLIGTPLPPLDKTRDVNEFVPLWKQEVRDEKGRRRLHGAFTGGFSAGYFNTVGSKEGWTPSTFKSSRNDRNQSKAARPEDFMDEEDLVELQESRKLVDKDDVSGPILPQPSEEDDSISAALSNLLPPLNDSIGAQMLKKMGWKPGQGIGPRLTYDQLLKRHEVDGTPLPSMEHEEAKKHTYAPRDTAVPVLKRKDDFGGLGYLPLAGLRTTKELEGPKLSAGFGLGALNDAEDDDVDVYDSGLHNPRRRIAFEAGDEDEERAVSSKTSTKQAPNFQSAGFFKNGATLLPGFTIADIPTPPQKKFEPPQVPEDWEPNPNRVWDSKWDMQPQASTSSSTGSGPVPHEQWKKGISADERGSLLGETPLPAAKKSIWDYLSQKDRERLQGFKNVEKGSTAQYTSTSAPPPVAVIDVPRTDAPIAKAALQGFQPFVDNPLKQARYIAYLTSQASSQPMTLQPLSGQSIQDFNTELEGFAKAARVFKPMSAAMASRFVGAKVAEKTKEVKEGLYQPADEAYLEGEKANDEEGGVPVEESPKEHAARMGMFGKMTRESKEWAPARLLCKRFKVPLPKNEGGKEEEGRGQEYAPATNDTKGDVSMEIVVDVNGGGGTRVVVNESDGTGEGAKRDMANIGLGEDDTQGRDTLTYERPAMDIFKAIFASDEEDSDEEENTKEPSKSTVDTSGDVKMADGQNTTETKPSIPSGPVDLTTFRPTFVSRSKMGGTTSTEKSSKPTKKKTKVAPLSFMDEDGEGTGITVVPAKKRKRDKDGEGVGKKKKTEEKEKSMKMEVDEEDNAMWVEKPSAVPTQIVKNRPKAADFL